MEDGQGDLAAAAGVAVGAVALEGAGGQGHAGAVVAGLLRTRRVHALPARGVLQEQVSRGAAAHTHTHIYPRAERDC